MSKGEDSAGGSSITVGWKDAFFVFSFFWYVQMILRVVFINVVRGWAHWEPSTWKENDKKNKIKFACLPPPPSIHAWPLFSSMSSLLTGEPGMRLSQPKVPHALSFLINYFRYFPIKVNLCFSCFHTVCSKTEHLNWPRTGFLPNLPLRII